MMDWYLTRVLVLIDFVVVKLSVEAKMTKEAWNDSLLDNDSIVFKRLEAKLKRNVSGTRVKNSRSVCPDETKADCLDYAKMEVPIPTFCGLLFGLKLVT